MKSVADSLKRIDEKKKKLDAFHPLPPELVSNLQEWLAVEFTYTSNAIEGNTHSFSETAMVVEKGITIGGKSLREHLEIINHAQAIDFIVELARKKKYEVALDDILAIHKIVLQKIDDLHAGILRDVTAKVVGSRTIFPNPAKVPFLMVDFMSWLHTAQDHPVIIAALAHYKLVTIHPFIDGNGRTARLLMNLLLLQHGYPLAIIKKEQRPEYIAAIEHARETDDFDPFYAVIISAVEYSLDIYLESIEQSNLS
ncbi:MAG TPA: Fic family protein [Candidatus Babeliales bacterium]|jgi:Fic family protein|nr:Fic family protein [Candidatus Babeliales bacterium]